jgi:transcriptional regulator with XRE-family HTH domain
MKTKRSQERRITVQSKVVRFLRLSRGISQREAARQCRISEPAIGHYENGRMDVSPARLEQFLRVYGYTRQEYDEYLGGKAIPVISVRDECVSLLGKIDEVKLRAVHAVLASFVA